MSNTLVHVLEPGDVVRLSEEGQNFTCLLPRPLCDADERFVIVARKTYGAFDGPVFDYQFKHQSTGQLVDSWWRRDLFVFVERPKAEEPKAPAKPEAPVKPEPPKSLWDQHVANECNIAACQRAVDDDARIRQATADLDRPVSKTKYPRYLLAGDFWRNS